MAEMKICPYCGEEILAVAKKCKHCGEWLEENEPEKSKEQVPCPICAEVIDKGTKVCPFCHEELNWEDNYVEDTTLFTEEESKESEEEDSTPRGFWDYCFAEPILHNYFNFREPMSAKQFWLTFLAVTLLDLASFGLSVIFDPKMYSFPYVWMICTTFLIIPLVAIMCRRIIDVDVPVWMLTIVGLIILISISSFIKGIVKEDFAFFEKVVIICSIIFIIIWVLNLPLAIWFARSGFEECKPIKFKTLDWVITIVAGLIFIIGLCSLDTSY